MALQSSGAISFSELQTEFSDTGSISMSELYKGGSLVPSTVLVIGSTVGPYGHYFGVGTDVDGLQYYWAISSSVTWRSSSQGNPGSSTQLVSGGYRYFRGAYFGQTGSLENLYQVSRRSETDTAVNDNVPASGAIDLSNFYDGRGS